jgi:hypothetical protein
MDFSKVCGCLFTVSAVVIPVIPEATTRFPDYSLEE